MCEHVPRRLGLLPLARLSQSAGPPSFLIGKKDWEIMQWFRFYAEALNDPKVQSLDGETFKSWVNMLCVAAQNDGLLPLPRNVSFMLRVTVDEFLSVSRKLYEAGLLDVTDDPESSWAIHSWGKRQYKSDTSTERVKRFRQRYKAVTVTPPEQNRTDTDTETDTESNTRKNKKIEKPFDVSQDIWEDFLRHRKAKRSPVTDTALARIRSECLKVGWSMDQALGEICARGWQGFKAEWVLKDSQGASKQPVKRNYTDTLADAARRAHENLAKQPTGGENYEIFG